MLWVLFGLGAAFMAAIMPLLQERYKVDSFALACWVKVVTVSAALPFVLWWGLPTQPLFYVLVAGTAVLYSISDVIYFRAAATVGAGVLTRLLPVTVIGTFFLWFLVQPSLLHSYLAAPWVSGGIVLVLCFAVYCAMHLKQCTVTMQALRIIWPLLLVAVIGPLLAKPALGMAPQPQVVPAYMLVQGLMMLACWLAYGLVKKRHSLALVWARPTALIGLQVGLASALCALCKSHAYIYADNPAYANMLLFTDSVFVLLIYKILGRKNDSNVWAGMGIVAAAALLVLLKSQIN